jgi:colanic acid/amylovoran biosynthesis protein
MIIEVTGTNTWNKGAELMIASISKHFRDKQAKIAVGSSFGTYNDKAKYRLLQKVGTEGISRTSLGMAILSDSFRRSFGLVMDDDIDVVLDSSGYAFGDHSPIWRTKSFAERAERAHEHGNPVVLLPQAFGPFKSTERRNAFARIVEVSDLVFARDEKSLQYVKEAGGDRDYIKTAPDFTNLLQPNAGSEGAKSKTASIVPNQRMIEEAGTTAEAEAYVPFIASCIRAVKAEGLNPQIVLHGKPDVELAEEIQNEVGHSMRCVEKSDPLQIKQILGQSRLVIGSRYHALVAALSQGVPAIGTSWSHKYEMLFQDYGCEELLLTVDSDHKDVVRKVKKSCETQGGQLRTLILENAESMRNETEKMWSIVEKVIKQ